MSLSQAVGVGNKKEDELKHSKLNKVPWFNTVVLTVGCLLAICSEILADSRLTGFNTRVSEHGQRQRK